MLNRDRGRIDGARGRLAIPSSFAYGPRVNLDEVRGNEVYSVLAYGT